MAGADPRVIEIDEHGIGRIRDRINQAQREFARKASELHTQLGNMQQAWQGEGGVAFGALMTEWQERQAGITRLLRHFEDSLVHTQKTSVEQDSAQAANMFALNKSLNR